MTDVRTKPVFLSVDLIESAADRKDRKEKNIMPTGNSNYRVVININKLSSKIIVAAIEVHFFKWLLLLSVLSTESNKRLYLSVLCVSAVNFCFYPNKRKGFKYECKTTKLCH
jgi:hypothetical protein